jgi:hypothetical protein
MIGNGFVVAQESPVREANRSMLPPCYRGRNEPSGPVGVQVLRT